RELEHLALLARIAVEHDELAGTAAAEAELLRLLQQEQRVVRLRGLDRPEPDLLLLQAVDDAHAAFAGHVREDARTLALEREGLGMRGQARVAERLAPRGVDPGQRARGVAQP